MYSYREIKEAFSRLYRWRQFAKTNIMAAIYVYLLTKLIQYLVRYIFLRRRSTRIWNTGWLYRNIGNIVFEEFRSRFDKVVNSPWPIYLASRMMARGRSRILQVIEKTKSKTNIESTTAEHARLFSRF